MRVSALGASLVKLSSLDSRGMWSRHLDPQDQQVKCFGNSSSRSIVCAKNGRFGSLDIRAPLLTGWALIMNFLGWAWTLSLQPILPPNPQPDIVKKLTCLEGQGDLVSRLITPIAHTVIRVIPIINLLTKSP